MQLLSPNVNLLVGLLNCSDTSFGMFHQVRRPSLRLLLRKYHSSYEHEKISSGYRTIYIIMEWKSLRIKNRVKFCHSFR